MNHEYKQFKSLTGYTYVDIGIMCGQTRQAMHLQFNNKSLIYKASRAYLMGEMVDRKISELKAHIDELERFKKQIKYGVFEEA